MVEGLWHNLAFVESPIQIALVLMIALIVFGPKRLPEIGKQIGSALRELRKATGDITRSFNTDYDPEPDAYDRSTSNSYEPYNSGGYTRPRGVDPPIDLTDYTLAGAVPNDTAAGPSTDLYDAYRIAPSLAAASAPTNGDGGAAPTDAVADAAPEVGAESGSHG